MDKNGKKFSNVMNKVPLQKLLKLPTVSDFNWLLMFCQTNIAN